MNVLIHAGVLRAVETLASADANVAFSFTVSFPRAEMEPSAKTSGRTEHPLTKTATTRFQTVERNILPGERDTPSAPRVDSVVTSLPDGTHGGARPAVSSSRKVKRAVRKPRRNASGSFYAAVLVLAVLGLAWAPSPLSAAETSLVRSRFLFLIDNSLAMEPHKEQAAKFVAEMFRNGFEGWVRRGESVGIWTFNERLVRDAMPVEFWTEQQKERIAAGAERFVSQVRFEKSSRFDLALDAVQSITARAESVTVFIISTSQQRMSGTRFNAHVNDAYDEIVRTQSPRSPAVVTRFVARRGELLGWSAHALAGLDALDQPVVFGDPIALAPPAKDSAADDPVPALVDAGLLLPYVLPAELTEPLRVRSLTLYDDDDAAIARRSRGQSLVIYPEQNLSVFATVPEAAPASIPTTEPKQTAARQNTTMTKASDPAPEAALPSANAKQPETNLKAASVTNPVEKAAAPTTEQSAAPSRPTPVESVAITTPEKESSNPPARRPEPVATLSSTAEKPIVPSAIITPITPLPSAESTTTAAARTTTRSEPIRAKADKDFVRPPNDFVDHKSTQPELRSGSSSPADAAPANRDGMSAEVTQRRSEASPSAELTPSPAGHSQVKPAYAKENESSSERAAVLGAVAPIARYSTGYLATGLVLLAVSGVLLGLLFRGRRAPRQPSLISRSMDPKP